MSIALLVLSIVYNDGMALLATLLLSMLSTFIGVANHWTLQLPSRPTKRQVPDGDVILKYPQGAFVVVKCDEDVARELY